MLFTRKSHIPLIQIKNINKRNSSQHKFSHEWDLSATGTVHISLWRAVLSTAFHWKATASLTVETVMVLPIFLFICISFVFFGEVFLIHQEIQGSLLQSARELSETVLLIETGLEKGAADMELAESFLGAVRAKNIVTQYAGDVLEKSSCLVGGKSGLNFYYSKIRDNYVDVIVKYEVSLPYSFGFNASFPIVQRCRLRAWSGSSLKKSETEEMVYITNNGTVYHESPDCSHIKLQVRSVGLIELKQVRNNNGSKYKACEKCAPRGMDGKCVYITTDGDRYHNSLSCSGLKRSVSACPKSQVKDKTACSRCCGS